MINADAQAQNAATHVLDNRSHLPRIDVFHNTDLQRAEAIHSGRVVAACGGETALDLDRKPF